MLAIEDLHWSDTSTRDFLTFLVRGIRRERLALILTYRGRVTCIGNGQGEERGGVGAPPAQWKGRGLLASAPGRRLGVRATITLDGSAPVSTGLELVQVRQRHQHA
ncbi:MAG TPA: hypothetical protein VME22_25185 [Solirubrobacteraceae bacterium]|nr:hypothetical protein [Solirubrobacteraceae bacterium]